MIDNIIINRNIVDKASLLREGNILNHEYLSLAKIKLTKIWENKKGLSAL